MNAAIGDARLRILDAALDCFAAKGYKATTIVDIEEAAGLSPGSGGTYRHFKSKREMLEVAIERARADNDAFLAPVNTSMVGSAHDGIELFRRNRHLFTLLFRDLAQFPDLVGQVSDLVLRVYRVAAERTAVITPDGDAEAIAVVVSGAMLSFGLFETMLGTHALDVDEERFAQAWGLMLNLLIAHELGCDLEDLT